MCWHVMQSEPAFNEWGQINFVTPKPTTLNVRLGSFAGLRSVRQRSAFPYQLLSHRIWITLKPALYEALGQLRRRL
jgi:hypothetical protein